MLSFLKVSKFITILLIMIQTKLTIRSYFAIYAMASLAALCSFVMGYSHVFLSQMESILQLKSPSSP